MLEPGIAIVERDPAIESLMDLYGGSGKAEASGLRMDLQPVTVPLDNVVVTDDTLMSEAADAIQIFRSRAPGLFRIAGDTGEAAIVVGEEAAQDQVGGVEIAGLCQAKLAGEAVLQHPPKALDAAFGLGTLSGDESDAELLESATELSGFLLAGELFVDGPVLVVASENAAAIAVESDGDTVAAQQALQQAEIALGSFRGEELGGQDFAGSIVLHAQSGEPGAAAFEPVMRRAVELDQFALTSRAQTALAMSGWSALTRRTNAVDTEQPAQGFAAQREAFLFDELVVQVMIVEAGVARACQSEDTDARALGQTAVAGPAAADVRQSRCAALPVARLQPFDMARR